MALLESIEGPRDLDRLTDTQLDGLAQEIRDFLIHAVAQTSGHLGPNLGVVELTLALHRVFDSPRDRILFDVGHQAYVHKLLTGRRDGFERLRKAGGLSGYPCQAESEHDIIENSHASTALSYADGLAKAHQLRGERRQVAVVVGDGALTGGMAWEALNNIAAAKDRPMVIVVNDNERSYSPTIGGLADHLATLRMTDGYEQFLRWGKTVLQSTPGVGRPLLGALHGAKKGIKDFVAPQGMFEDLGLKYVGPIDGHDERAVEAALRRAKGFTGPVIVHCITEKGRGYRPAEQDDERFHQVKVIHPDTGLPVSTSGRDWTAVFSDEIVRIGSERPDVVAITAAMVRSTGLEPFAARFPERTFDVGIAEQHATTSAAGLAMGGLHPVVAIYSTFLNRAFDQVLLDVALHRCAVTFVLDRSGVTGDDGPSHNGMWDLSALHIVPGLRIAAPRDGARLRELLREAVDVDDGPTVLRYPKGTVSPDLPAVERVGAVDVLRRTDDPSGPAGSAEVLMVAVGAMVEPCLDAAGRLEDHGVSVTLVDPRWLKPVDPALVELARGHRLVVTVEDNGRSGGYGAALAQALEDADVITPHRGFGLPQEFLAPGERGAILAEVGLSAQAITRRTVEAVARLSGAVPGVLAGDPRSNGGGPRSNGRASKPSRNGGSAGPEPAFADPEPDQSPEGRDER